jgi:hypothetical protein
MRPRRRGADTPAARGDAPRRGGPSASKDDCESEMSTYPVEFHRRCEQGWESRAASRFLESARRMPWLLAIGRTLRAELDAVEHPVSERLGAVLKELERRTAT